MQYSFKEAVQINANLQDNIQSAWKFNLFIFITPSFHEIKKKIKMIKNKDSNKSTLDILRLGLGLDALRVQEYYYNLANQHNDPA